MATNHSDLLGSRTGRRQPGQWFSWRIVALALIALLAAGVLYLVNMVNAVVQEISDPISAEVAPEVRPVPVQVGQRYNVLVMGLDDERLRSDTMMLVSIDPDSRKIGVLSIPRDTRALLAGKGTIEKINGAYAYGVGDKRFPGNLRALKTVEDLLEIQIHYTVVVDMGGFRQVINEIGGVWVDIPFDMDYDDPDQDLSIKFTAGRQKLDGQKALEYVRFRANNDGTGYPDADLGRIRAQQQFMRSALDEALKPANLLRLTSQATSIAQYVETTFEPSRITSLAAMAARIGKDDVEFAMLPGIDAYLYDSLYGKHLSFFIVDPAATRSLVDRLIRGIDPAVAGKVRVEIADGDAMDRVARVSERLAGQGFKVSQTARNGGARLDRTQVIDQSGNMEKAQLVGRSLVSQGFLVEIISQPDEHPTADVLVILEGR